MLRCRGLTLFLCCLLSIVVISGCGGDSDGDSSGGGSGDGSGGGSSPPPPTPAATVTLQGKVDDDTPNSPIPGATCRFLDTAGTQLATATADTNGVFQIAVPPNVQGFLRCTPPLLSNLMLSAFASTTGKSGGDTIANLAVTPATTLLADILATTTPPDLDARATALTAAGGG